MSDDKRPAPGANWGVGIAIGIGIGVAFGAALGNIAIGISLGVAFGVVISLFLDDQHKRKADRDEPEPPDGGNAEGPRSE